MDIYVGNLSSEVVEVDLQKLFELYGEVTSVGIIKHRRSGRSMGFGIVKMASREEAIAAITGLKGKKFKDRTLDVNEAMSRPHRRGYHLSRKRG
ncbi:MAG: RNA-binding protein [Candidatus Omnitrophica bacterium]|nr:RNA-binding protein [Candidatus Omnitrophota bacterium]